MTESVWAENGPRMFRAALRFSKDVPTLGPAMATAHRDWKLSPLRRRALLHSAAPCVP